MDEENYRSVVDSMRLAVCACILPVPWAAEHHLRIFLAASSYQLATNMVTLCWLAAVTGPDCARPRACQAAGQLCHPSSLLRCMQHPATLTISWHTQRRLRPAARYCVDSLPTHRQPALQDGSLFGLPVVLDTRDPSIQPGDKVLLTYQGQDLATVEISSQWEPNKPLEAQQCYGTTSIEHPAVAMITGERGKYYLGAAHSPSASLWPGTRATAACSLRALSCSRCC